MFQRFASYMQDNYGNDKDFKKKKYSPKSGRKASIVANKFNHKRKGKQK